MRKTEKTLPITWLNWDEPGDPGDVQFYDVEFTSDFGPFDSGEKVDSLYLSMQKGVLQSYDENGNVVKTINIRLTTV